MNPNAGLNFRRTLVAIVTALIALLVLIPLLYDVAGIRTNLEESIAPTFVAELRRNTRTPRTPTPLPATPLPTVTLLPTVRPTPHSPLPTVTALNGVSIQRLIYISDAARAHLREIYTLGQSLGRDSHSISKVGDSTMLNPPFLVAFDRKVYRLGRYNYLQATIDYHAGSFGRESAAVKKGIHTWSQFDPEWAVPELCGPTEGPLECELRLHNPSIVFIRLGANDTPYPSMFEKNLGAIVKYCLQRGIIPILGTKPDRHEGDSNLINNIIRKTASAYSVPLWDYDLIAATVPGRGLEPDGLHIRADGSRDYSDPSNMASGGAMEDLSALMMLDSIHRELADLETVAAK